MSERNNSVQSLQVRIFQKILLLGIIPVAALWGFAFVLCLIHGAAGYDSMPSYLWRWSLLATGVLIAVIIVVGLVVSDRMMRPFQQLIRAVDEVKAGGEDNFTPVTDYQETVQISEACVAMLQRLKNLDKTQQEFVSNVSHELKTPMASMKVLADSLVGRDDVPVEVYREFMEDIGTEIDRETEIVNDLLTLSRLDKESAQLDIQEVNINAMLAKLKRKMTPIAQKNGIVLLFDTIRSVTAEVDESRMEMVITNLIENAIKYNHVGGWVRVVLDLDRTSFSITVADNGIGIPKEAQEQIFERFYRADESHSKTVSGSGLGLSLVRKAVGMHHGTIRVASAPEEGSEFTVRIPLRYAAR